MGVLIGLLVLWLIVMIVGFTVKALLWLAIAGVVLFIGTTVYGVIRHQRRDT